MRRQNFNLKKKREINGPSAVALHYDEGNGDIPQVVARGKGFIAQKIIESAKQNDVPLQEDSSLIGNLIDMDLGENIPPQLYSVIAEVLLMLEEMEKSL
ncbi:EscU/YscU/HrcU family type III secretion system export apparatus switch protein [Sporosalibacterium faouarense]|uniref:EscU/YscU/HrcU family type III secretion system export apparatus switch protein n=1 Tax=Sporosalibacterium faouarense TaxID=516123 RepID=UPI00141C57C8|nr:EscU/YscU/HrcU family type III secretion system export apparatus switch protein [Sporosalibacterium faouarense]MTI46621.1 flagellar biosynthesis protein FlhS [Bacillota bacterium]